MDNKTNINLTIRVRKLEKELEMIYRDFNGLVRLFYQFNSLDNFRVLNSPCVQNNKDLTCDLDLTKKNKNKKLTKKLESNLVSGLAVKINSPKKLTKKKKRPIIWNAWVIDSSSESSDSD